ncbi:maleylpyruvate isomerase N-terminal domain-containing protein [Nocardioides sp. AX2bis]|uniref:maleylpyruvate isomerase N-terminal domain-containing protein n=1 Tax=Nocardioides sp. AX2bis TaxID=2653157 RepID=UPI0012F2BF03|nr:maleylpyruvate isomerase N-terminal domain-containing protein [Nocardioides sp. AX2bis]VXC59319.1 conserved hypothetical protein [Nocardioides sp. AX2bis]
MAVDLLADAYAGTSRAVAALAPEDWERPTRAAAWPVRALLHHQLVDAQRALVALACTTDAAPDVDRTTYWADFLPDGDAGAGLSARVAAAYDDPADLRAQWTATATAVVRASGAADPTTRVETQGHVITVDDLVSTLVVEATVHHLDLVLDLDDPGPSAACLAHTRAVLERILGDPLPASWDDGTAVLRSTGREALDDADRAALGVRAGRLPLLG